MGVIVETAGRIVMKRPARKYTPAMASESDLRKLRAMYEADLPEAHQNALEARQEAAGRRMAARIS